MNLVLLVSVCVLYTSVQAACLQEFKQFKETYGKVYKDEEEESMRLKIFSQNIMKISEHRLTGSSSYQRGVNQWSDLTQDEWMSVYLGGYKHISTVHKPVTTQTNRSRLADLPVSIDWREEGVITNVKNQGACGSCWAVCSTELIESYVALETGLLVELSSQQVTSCTPNPVLCGGTGGCDGSTPPLAYTYAQLFGLVTEQQYPYVSGDSSNTEGCLYDYENMAPVAIISGYNSLPSNDMEAVMQHIAQVGPLAISVAASGFKDYHGGVFDGCSYEANIALNHAVQLVGYGTDPQLGDYWLVRNSWGERWGEDGYIRILKETNPQCGLDSTTTGHVCAGGPGSDSLTVCGMCGMLFETSFPLGAKLM